MNSRLQRLREILRLEWGELADHLGMSRAMLDFVRKGQRNLSFPALRRLEEAERAAGISPPVVPTVSAPTPAPATSAGMNQEKLEISPRASDDPLEVAMARLEAAMAMVGEAMQTVKVLRSENAHSAQEKRPQKPRKS